MSRWYSEALEGPDDLLHHLDREHIGGRSVENDAGDPLDDIEADEAILPLRLRREDVVLVRILEVRCHQAPLRRVVRRVAGS